MLYITRKIVEIVAYYRELVDDSLLDDPEFLVPGRMDVEAIRRALEKRETDSAKTLVADTPQPGPPSDFASEGLSRADAESQQPDPPTE